LISINISEIPDSSWNERIIEAEIGGLGQTIEFSKSTKLSLKFRPKFLKFFTDSDELVGQLLLFEYYKGQKRLSAKIGRGKLFLQIVKLLKIFPKLNYWIHGPIIFNLKYKNEIFNSLENYLIKNNLKFSCIEQPKNYNSLFFKNFNYKEYHTFIINLEDGIEKILKNTEKKSVQKNIQRSKIRGVTITQIISHNDLLIYYKLLKEFRKNNNLSPYSYDDIVTTFEILKNIGHKGFLAWHDNLPIGGILISTFNGYINELGIARSKKDYEEKLYSLELLRWKIIEWGIENKCKYYDLTGVTLDSNNSKELGIYQNKKKWGGELVPSKHWFN
jgi:hypothetical protein